MLKSDRQRMIIVIITFFLSHDFTKKDIKSFFDFFGRFPESFDGISCFWINYLKTWEYFMSQQISRYCCILIGFINSIENILMFRVLENFFFRYFEKWSEIYSREAIDAHKTRDTRSFCDPIEKRLCLIISMMCCQNTLSCIFFPDTFEP